MREGAEVNDDGFAQMIAGLVERHPALCYRMVLEDSHIPLHAVKSGFFGDTFLEVFRQYNNALFDSVRHPVFMVACDLPNVFKDQLVRGCVKLATVAKGDYSYLREGRRGWYGTFRKVCVDVPLGRKIRDVIDGDLYKDADATHFRDLHGSSMHDLSQSLVSGLEQTVSVGNYIMMQTYIGAFDLDKELEALDRQRRRIQKAYQLFGDYGDAMYEGRSGN